MGSDFTKKKYSKKQDFLMIFFKKMTLLFLKCFNKKGGKIRINYKRIKNLKNFKKS